MHLDPIQSALDCLLQQWNQQLPDATIWLVEKEQNSAIAYVASTTLDSIPYREHCIKFESIDEIDNIVKKIGKKGKFSTFEPIFGNRFGQKKDDRYIAPETELVGLVEFLSNDLSEQERRNFARVVSLVVWNHRSARFLEALNEIQNTLFLHQNENPDWLCIDEVILRLTHSDRAAILESVNGSLRLIHSSSEGLDEIEKYKNLIMSNSQLSHGRWIRSGPSLAECDGIVADDAENELYWMIVPLSSTFVDLEKGLKVISSGVKYYCILETKIAPISEKLRRMYTSADRRLVEHALNYYLVNTSGRRMEQRNAEIASSIPTDYFESPREGLQKGIEAIRKVVSEVEHVCIIEKNVRNYRSTDELEYTSSTLATDNLDSAALYKLLFAKGKDLYQFDHDVSVTYADYCCFVVAIGNTNKPRFIIFMFGSNLVNLEAMKVCSTAAKDLEIYWQSCDLGREQTSTITHISHVIRGPVHGGLEAMKLLKSRLFSQPLKHENFRSPVSDEEVLTRIINELSRALSVANSAKFLLKALDSDTFTPRKVDLHAILSEVRGSLGYLADRNKQTIRVAVTNEAAGRLNVKGDSDLLWLLLYNLLENAIKHGTRSTNIDVNLSAGPNQNTIRVSVKNNGQLINDDDAEKIFEPFKRGLGAHNLNLRPGTGLGLPAANQIANAFSPHMGISLVQSSKKTGTTKLGELTFSFVMEKFKSGY